MFQTISLVDSAHDSTLENVSNVSPATTAQSFEDLMRELNETSLQFGPEDFDNLARPYYDENGVLNETGYYNAWANMFRRNKRDVINNANAYIYQGHKFIGFEIRPGVYGNIRYRGRFYGQKEKNIVLLVHGWHAFHSSDGLFKQLLRFHQKLTPEVGVIYINWEKQGAMFKGLGNAAEAAVRVNVNALLVDIIPSVSKVHCIGHSLGAHACAAICRSYRHIHNASCSRIVGLDPAGPWFQFDSPPNGPRDFRLSARDADYVVSLVTNRQMSAIYTPIGHEYLTTNVDGEVSESCAALGKYVGQICGTGFSGNTWCETIDLGTVGNSGIIPHTKDTCSHLMAIVQFMKTLDINNPLALFKKQNHVPLGLDRFIPSVWTGYTIGKDYTYDTFKLDNVPVWYSYVVDGDSLKSYEIIIVMSNGPISVNMAKKVFEIRHGEFYETLLLGFNTYERRTDYYLRVTGQFYLMRVLKPQSHIGHYMAPMPAFAERVYSCDRITNMYFTHHCTATDEHKIISVYRKQMSVSPEVVSVPPKSGCLPYNNELSDTIQMRIPGISVVEGDVVRIKLNVSHNDELLKVVLNRKIVSINHSTNYTLFTLWDNCNPTYCADVVVNRIEQLIDIRFNDDGYYDLYFVFQFHRDIMPIQVRKRPLLKQYNSIIHPTTRSEKPSTSPSRETEHTTSFGVTYKITMQESTEPATIQPFQTTALERTSNEVETTTLTEHSTHYTVADSVEDDYIGAVMSEKQFSEQINKGGLSGGLVGGIIVLVIIVIGGLYFTMRRKPTIVVMHGEANELMSSCA